MSVAGDCRIWNPPLPITKHSSAHLLKDKNTEERPPRKGELEAKVGIADK